MIGRQSNRGTSDSDNKKGLCNPMIIDKKLNKSTID
jgi:hypothetical protein